VISRVFNRLRNEGLRATAREVWQRLRKLAYLREEHTWWQLDLDEERPRFELAEGLRFVRATPDDVGAVAAFGHDPAEALRRLEAGNDLWVVLDGDEPLFACYTFRQSTPVMAASGGTLALPDGAACVEDSIATPAARGRGIGPACWTRVWDKLQEEGFRFIVTKIETTNKSSNRAAEKSGFRPIAVMEHERVVMRRHTAVKPVGHGLGEELAARLT
jgi:RimJ/RimL family protein N-acetyltransferase